MDPKSHPAQRRPSSHARLRIATALIALLLVTPAQAAAYIDPISGSIILQVLAAGALGALLTIKRVWAAVTGAGRRFWEGFTGLWRR
jgi:hypothetical protein